MKRIGFFFATFVTFGATSLNAQNGIETDAKYFEGRWAFAEEACDLPSNWTMISGGNFVSEDLTGTWEWLDGQLKLSLVDLAIDEETGEVGGRFQMTGPVEIKERDSFFYKIAPDVYQMKRCSD